MSAIDAASAAATRIGSTVTSFMVLRRPLAREGSLGYQWPSQRWARRVATVSSKVLRFVLLIPLPCSCDAHHLAAALTSRRKGCGCGVSFCGEFKFTANASEAVGCVHSTPIGCIGIGEICAISGSLQGPSVNVSSLGTLLRLRTLHAVASGQTTRAGKDLSPNLSDCSGLFFLGLSFRLLFFLFDLGITVECMWSSSSRSLSAR
mmetsp:Transcript_40417/g.108489  ORF Transcript_40417/g.108489 Transcript_40417/m.108489 type:complete len:205 (+) Transcript_40417:356-970(+)